MNMNKYYGIFMERKDKDDVLVWKSLEPVSGRTFEKKNYWLGGSDLLPMLLGNAQKAHSMLKKVQKEFSQGNSIYRKNKFIVKRVSIVEI